MSTQKYPNRMLLAEANQWPEDSVAYFGDGNECHMCFHFPVMPRMFMAIRMEDRYPIIEILDHTPPIPANCQWAMFLRNHDELTLEMVTDEERDYMYRVYAHDRQMRINLGIRRRLAPLLGNDRRRIELMNALLFSLPGTPVVYYGDEIGMGDNIYLGDRNGVRTPMQWSADRNAGFSRSSPQKLYLPITSDPEYHYETINVEAQQTNPNSLLWWMKRIIEQRKQYKAFGRGTIRFLHPDNRHVLAFYPRSMRTKRSWLSRTSRDSRSTSHSTCPTVRDGSCRDVWEGAFPADRRPAIRGYAWRPRLLLVRDGAAQQHASPSRLPALSEVSRRSRLVPGSGCSTNGRLRGSPDCCRRFCRHGAGIGGKARSFRRVGVRDIIPIGESEAYIVIDRDRLCRRRSRCVCSSGASARGDEAAAMWKSGYGDTIVARLRTDGRRRGPSLRRSLGSASFRDLLLGAIARRRRFRGKCRRICRSSHARISARVGWQPDRISTHRFRNAEQSNSSIILRRRFILKLFRKIEPGVHPDIEIGTFLTAKGFPIHHR